MLMSCIPDINEVFWSFKCSLNVRFGLENCVRSFEKCPEDCKKNLKQLYMIFSIFVLLCYMKLFNFLFFLY